MKKRRRALDPPASTDLRRRAEASLEAQPHEQPRELLEGTRMVYELQVHRIELEMQNEELRAARGEAEAALQRYTQIFEFAPVGYFILGGDGSVYQANRAVARVLGVERERLLGRRFGLYVAESERRRLSDFFSRVASQSSEESEACELALDAHGGAERRIRLTGALLPSGCPGVSGLALLVALEDVTERRRIEAALHEEAHHKDDFLAALSHELRNPLAAIRSALYVLEHAPAGGEGPAKARAVVDRQFTHLTRLIDELLDITRIARGKVELSMQRIRLQDAVARTVEDYRPTFDREGIELTADMPTQAIWVEADPTRLVQALGNLLGNAVKFTNRGGKVAVGLRSDARGAELSVRDNGIGIPSEAQQYLFAPFRQAPQPPDRRRGGLGLGLAMVKGLVEMHGGTVQAQSAGAGRGSTFTVRLPVVGTPAESGPAVHDHAPADPARRTCRVLLIEDNVDAADTLREVLELAGHEVRSAYDGPSGITLARQFRPEIVICDIGLPGMDGYDVARAIHTDSAIHPRRLVALSGYGRADDLRRAADAGFDTQLVKPPDLDELQRLIEESCGPEGAAYNHGHP